MDQSENYELFKRWIIEAFSIYKKDQNPFTVLNIDAKWKFIQAELKESFLNELHGAMYEAFQNFIPGSYADIDPNNELKGGMIPETLKKWMPKHNHKTPIEFLQFYHITKDSWQRIIAKLKERFIQIVIKGRESTGSDQNLDEIRLDFSYPKVLDHFLNEDLTRWKIDPKSGKLQYINMKLHKNIFPHESQDLLCKWLKTHTPASEDDVATFKDRYQMVSQNGWLQEIPQCDVENLIPLTESYLSSLCQTLPIEEMGQVNNLLKHLVFYCMLRQKVSRITCHSVETREYYQHAIEEKLRYLGIVKTSTVAEEFVLERSVANPERWADGQDRIKSKYESILGSQSWFESPVMVKKKMKEIHSFHKGCQKEFFKMLNHLQDMISKENGHAPHILEKGRVVYEKCMVADGRFHTVIDQITVRAQEIGSINGEVKVLLSKIIAGRYLEHLARQNNLLDEKDYIKWKSHHQVLVSYAALYEVLKDKTLDGNVQNQGLDTPKQEIELTSFWRDMLIDDYLLYKEDTTEDDAAKAFLERSGIDKKKWEKIIQASIDFLKNIFTICPQQDAVDSNSSTSDEDTRTLDDGFDIFDEGTQNANTADPSTDQSHFENSPLDAGYTDIENFDGEVEMPGDLAKLLQLSSDQLPGYGIRDRKTWTELLGQCRADFRKQMQAALYADEEQSERQKEYWKQLQEMLSEEKDLEAMIENIKKKSLFDNEGISSKIKKGDQPVYNPALSKTLQIEDKKETQSEIAGRALQSIKDIELLVKFITPAEDQSSTEISAHKIVKKAEKFKCFLANAKKDKLNLKQFFTTNFFLTMEKLLDFCHSCCKSTKFVGKYFSVKGLIWYLELKALRSISTKVFHAKVEEHSLRRSVISKQRALFNASLSENRSMKEFMLSEPSENAMEELLEELKPFELQKLRPGTELRRGVELTCSEGVLAYKFGSYKFSQFSLVDQLTLKTWKTSSEDLPTIQWEKIKKRVMNNIRACYSLVERFIKNETPSSGDYRSWVEDFQTWISFIVLHTVVEEKLSNNDSQLNETTLE